MPAVPLGILIARWLQQPGAWSLIIKYAVDLPEYGLTGATPGYANDLRASTVRFLTEVLNGLKRGPPSRGRQVAWVSVGQLAYLRREVGDGWPSEGRLSTERGMAVAGLSAWMAIQTIVPRQRISRLVVRSRRERDVRAESIVKPGYASALQLSSSETSDAEDACLRDRA